MGHFQGLVFPQCAQRGSIACRPARQPQCRNGGFGPGAPLAPPKWSGLVGETLSPFGSRRWGHGICRSSSHRPTALQRARYPPRVQRTKRHDPVPTCGFDARRRRPCHQVVRSAPAPAALLCLRTRVRFRVRKPCQSGLRWRVCCDPSQRSCGAPQPHKLLRRRIESRACRPPGAFPWALLWSLVKIVFPNPRQEKQLCE